MKSKFTASAIAIFGACALCCLVPIFSLASVSSVIAYLSSEKFELAVTFLIFSTGILFFMFLINTENAKIKNFALQTAVVKPNKK